MIEQLIADVNKALDAEAYMAALSLVLTLPDICAKAEYGSMLGNKKRYIKWFDEYIGKSEKPPHYDNCPEMPYLSGEVVYQLRCSVLHQGAPNIDKSKIIEEPCKIDHFTLIIERKNPFDIYSDSASVGGSFYDTDLSKSSRDYSVNIRRLCLVITLSAESYYKENESKFDFFDYRIEERT